MNNEVKKEVKMNEVEKDSDDKIKMLGEEKEKDEEIYRATKLILDEMSREDQKLTELDDIVRKPKREMVWKRSEDGVLRRVFKMK
jgi:hypothetical protein